MGEGMRVSGVYRIKHPRFSYQILAPMLLENEQLLWWWMNSCCGDEWTADEELSEQLLRYHLKLTWLIIPISYRYVRKRLCMSVRKLWMEIRNLCISVRSFCTQDISITPPPWPFREMIIEADNCTVSILEIISSLFSSFTSNILLFKNYLRKSVKILSVLNNFPPKVFSFRILFVPLRRISTSAGRRLSRGFPRHCG